MGWQNLTRFCNIMRIMSSSGVFGGFFYRISRMDSILRRCSVPVLTM